MKNAIDWIKTNPIVTGAAIVSFLGVIVIGYFLFASAPKFSADKSDILKKENQQLKSLQNIPVPLPNEDPNAPPDIHEVVVNEIVINRVSDIYSEIQGQYDQILVSAQQKNSQNHLQFVLGGGEIWPDKDPKDNFALYFQAAADYRAHFKAAFDKDNATNNWNMPHMIASSPPTQEELGLLLDQTAFEFISSVGAQSANELSQNQANQLYAEQRMVLMQALNFRARSINIYAQLPPEEDPFAPTEPEDGTEAPASAAPAAGPFGGGGATAGGAGAPAAYPFHIEAWAYAEQAPTPDQLWEGQVQLWIMRDILGTISQFNQVGQQVEGVSPDGAIVDEPASVVNSPIKRLLVLKTLPGYVGLHNTGAALSTADILSFGTEISLNSGSQPGFGSPPLSPGGAPGTAGTPSIYPTPDPALTPKEVTENAAEHFGITPTGRVSNSVFDVRHTQLTIHIEAAKLPAFMDAMHKTNFMTVIKADITDLDEYELLREGYIYGHADVVEVELIVESLWFRNWTEDLMPEIVKQKLLIIQPETNPSFQQPEGF